MWEKLTIDSKNTIDKYTKNKFSINDFSFTNLYLWSFGENIEYREQDGILTLRGYYDNSEYYFMPLGMDETEETISQIIATIKEIINSGYPIGYFDEYWKNKLMDEFEFRENRDYFDYVYNLEDLAYLKGRKYSKKRNRINNFLRNYNYAYETINEKNIDELIAFQEEWYNNHQILKEEIEILGNELEGIKNILHNFFKLDVKGGLIRVDGKIVSYTIGEKLNNNMVVIHIEKALIEYVGSYQAINSLFLQNEFSDIQFVNREDDFGDEGIREAKLSYYPIELLKKYDIKY